MYWISKTRRPLRRGAAATGLALLLCSCSLMAGKGKNTVAPPVAAPVGSTAATPLETPAAPSVPSPVKPPAASSVQPSVPPSAPPSAELPAEEQGAAELIRVPQRFAELVKAAGKRLDVGAECRTALHGEFLQRFFAPWTSSAPIFAAAEARELMKEQGRHGWYGVNKRRVPAHSLQELMENSALESFPSRNETAITVAPGHLRGLPTYLPLYEGADDEPFDMLSFPQVKLNEPLKVLHASRDGIWLFVETGYANGWLEARDVAFVDGEFIRSRMQAPQVVVVLDSTPVNDGKGTGTFETKIGTILPLQNAGKRWWEVAVASAGEGGRAQSRPSRIPRTAAAPFPLEFERDNVSLIGEQLLGQPYGWGEIYGLRDCSAMLRDFFLPFGIWLPRTSADQIASVPHRHELKGLTPRAKEQLIRQKGIPFLTLLYKPGHIMLYVGQDKEGRPLIFHDAWSMRVRERGRERTQIIGSSVITTLWPGKEQGVTAGNSLIERLTELAVIPERCPQKKQ